MSGEKASVKLRDLRNGKIFMVGIGGCSMSGLALLLKRYGYDVSGSTSIETEYLPMLKEQRIRFCLGHDTARLEGVDLVIRTQAISMENALMSAAAERGIPIRSRSWLLGQLSEEFGQSVCVCGTHGKTTVTSMLAQILIETDLNPTVHIGGIFPAMGGSIRNGSENLFLTEACEYQRSFLSLHPTGIILLNIDVDHLDYYRDIDEIEETFASFLKKLPEDGWALGCGEDERIVRQLQKTACRTTLYGMSDRCAYRMKNAVEDPCGYYRFDFFHDKDRLGHVRMGVPGIFNALNATAALAAAYILGVDAAAACDSIGRFRGAHRRFECTGTWNGAEIFHDYGHNPTEMRNALSIGRKRCKSGRLWAVMQPHTYSRVKSLFEGFVTCTEEADITLVTDICGDREDDPGDINSGMLTEGMKKHGVNAFWTPGFDDAACMLRDGVRPGDLVITMGCGDIYRLNDMLKEPQPEPQD